MYKSARCTQLIFWDKSQGRFPLSYVAVVASANGVGVVIGHGLLLYAGVEMEDALCVVLQSLFASFHCLVVGCDGVFGLSHLDYCASAVPSIRWIVGLPEWIGWGERHAVEGSVCGAHLAVAGRAVL